MFSQTPSYNHSNGNLDGLYSVEMFLNSIKEQRRVSVSPYFVLQVRFKRSVCIRTLHSWTEIH